MPAAFRLMGSSMLPVFKPGQVALVAAVNQTPGAVGLKGGDCAVYSHGGGTLLHRVVKTASNGVWFADDAGRIEPHFVPWGDIRGKVLSGHPLAGGLCGRVYSKLRRAASRIFINV